MTEANHLKAISKSANELIVGNYMVLFGGRDLMGEFFTKSTRFDSSYTDIGMLYVDFEHGLDPDDVGNDDSNVLGVVDWKSAKVDDKGIFVHRVLNRRASYIDFLSELIDAGVVGTSSEAIRGKTMKKPNGEITYWPLKRDSLTVTPMEPRMLVGNVLEAAKSLALQFPRNKGLASLTGTTIEEPQNVIKAIEAIDSLSGFERHLRDACGMSKSEATAMVSRIKSVISQSDSGEREPLAALSAALQARAVF